MRRTNVQFLPRLYYGIATIEMMQRLGSLDVSIGWLVLDDVVIVENLENDVGNKKVVDDDKKDVNDKCCR